MTYVYECPSCGEFEIQQSMHDAALTTCPQLLPAASVYGEDGDGAVMQCGEPVRRLITGGATIMPLPAYMSDANIEGRKAHRDWLKTPEAKAMNLTASRDS